MKTFNNNCSLKFVKRPNRLDLKFEKSFALATLKNNQAVLDDFPAKLIKSVYVSMTQVKDYKKYKEDKT
jgi:SNF2 family DNA or RNA helicase